MSVCVCVPTLHFPGVSASYYAWCFLKAELAQELDFLHERGGQSWERQFTLDSLKSNQKRVCFQDRVSGEGLFFTSDADYYPNFAKLLI